MIDPTVPWVLLRVRDQLFGVPASHIREMAEMPAVTRVPNMPEFVMGLVSLRGQVTPTIDMRRRLGVVTVEEDIKRLTDGPDRAEAEHRRLAETLEKAARDGRMGSIDTEACSFHEWLGSVDTKNHLVRLHLKKLEEPHAQLHAAAARVAEVAVADPGQAGAALRRFQEKELAAFLRLLPQVRERLVHAHRQIVVVFTFEGQSLGAAVDEVESIERLKSGSIEELPANLQGMKSSLTRMVGRRTRDDEIVLILEVEELFRNNGQGPIHGDWMEQAESTPASAPVRAPATATAASAGIAETASEAVPVRAVPVGPAAPSASLSSPGDNRDDHAWCGERNGPWVQLEEGPVVQPGASWEMEEAETGEPGTSPT